MNSFTSAAVTRQSSSAGGGMRVAIVHYWLVGEGGGEKVVKELCSLFPGADVFCLVSDPDFTDAYLPGVAVKSSYLNKVPFSRKIYRSLLPFMPAALESIDLSGYNLIISSESGPAKGVLVPLGAVHICYCHTPMRYLWDQYPTYRAEKGFLGRTAMTALITRLRLWDVSSSNRVDRFLANSAHVANRISQYYRRSSEVVYPPVDTDAFAIGDRIQDFYLITGRHVSYKRIDLAIAACRKMGRRLIITGKGPETESLKVSAGDTVEFEGQVSFDRLRELYASCRAFLMPGEEDFGLTPVEAMSSGRPVIAFGRGGALDTVVPGVSGLFFYEQSVDGLVDAITRFEENESLFCPTTIREHAAKFSTSTFRDRFADAVEGAVEAARHGSAFIR